MRTDQRRREKGKRWKAARAKKVMVRLLEELPSGAPWMDNGPRRGRAGDHPRRRSEGAWPRHGRGDLLRPRRLVRWLTEIRQRGRAGRDRGGPRSNDFAPRSGQSFRPAARAPDWASTLRAIPGRRDRPGLFAGNAEWPTEARGGWYACQDAMDRGLEVLWVTSDLSGATCFHRPTVGGLPAADADIAGAFIIDARATG